MGLPMAHALADAGFEVVAWNRTGAKVDELRTVAPTARTAGTPRAVAREAATVITMLPDLPQVRDQLDGPDGLRAGWADREVGVAPLLVVMGTVSPVALVELAEELADDGIHVVDAPVSGGPIGARERRLSIMVGGDVADVERVRPALEAMGSTIRHMGALGTGQLTKACNQAVVGGTLAALGEAVRLARAGGLDLATVLEVLGGGLAGSEALRQKGERYLTGDFSGGGASRNQLKDEQIILQTGEHHGVRLPVSEVVRDVYAQLVEQGDGDLDHSAVVRVE
jgi:2-hydroxy-3-oxopropionate reductase